MMSKSEFSQCLSELGLSQASAAELLSVNARTVRRWAENPAEIPGPARQALQAWRRLNKFGLPWRPDGIALPGDTDDELAEQISKLRYHAIGIDRILRRVRERGGPTAPWKVSLDKRKAELGTLVIPFYMLPNGSFSSDRYVRSSSPTSLRHEVQLIEDGIACIAKAIADRKKRGSK